MKKTVFALFAVLLVLSLATCDLLEVPQAAKSVNEDGQVMKTITIKVEGVGVPRALNKTNATTAGPGAADYYEVVFKSGTKYYEVAWDDTDGSATITIPIANYANTGNDAILFAGLKSNKTLLGVGTISTTVGGAGAGSNSNVTAATTGVTFTVTALTNGISNIAASSTFKITGPTNDVVHGRNYATTATGNTPAIAVGPIFPIPGVESGTAYSNPTSAAGGDITAEYSVTIPHNSGVILQAAWSITPVILSPWPGPEAAAGGGAVAYTPTAKTNNAALSATTVFDFSINVSAVTSDGLCAFTIDAPVRALSSTATYENSNAQTPFVWHIRGGTDNANADDGSGTGAAVVLAVGTHANFTRQITITNPGTGDWDD